MHSLLFHPFQTIRKKNVIKSYKLTGNPQKVKSRNYFNLDIYDSQDNLEKSIDKVNDALHYARTLTSYVNITPLTIMLYELLKKLDYGIDKTTALNDVIEFLEAEVLNSYSLPVMDMEG